MCLCAVKVYVMFGVLVAESDFVMHLMLTSVVCSLESKHTLKRQINNE